MLLGLSDAARADREGRIVQPLTPLPTSPKPATTATLPASMTSVARLIPSTRDSRQPY
jgi:hypothetical protein